MAARLGVLAAGLLLGAAGWAAPAMAAGGTDDPPPPPTCEPGDGGGGNTPPPPCYPAELGTATGHANPNAASGLDTAAEAITTARTRQEG